MIPRSRPCWVTRLCSALLLTSAIGATPVMGEERNEFGVCDWPFVSNPDTANIAYPDKYAIYWVSAVSGALPGTRFRIEGRYPDVRYFSFNVYDAALRPTDGIADFRINPEAGGTNPFRHANDPTGKGIGDPYTLIVETGAKPEERAHNTIYTGEIGLPGGAGGVHNPQFQMIYRIYVPRDFTAPQGGVDLPTITMETADGNTTLVPFSKCGPFTPDTGSALNEAVMGSDFPEGAAFVPYRLAPEDPRPTKFFGLPETVRNLTNNLIANPEEQQIPQSRITEGDGGGFLSNVDNAYLTLFFRRDRGNLYVIKAKAPLWEGDGRQEKFGNSHRATGKVRPTGRRAENGRSYDKAKVRYWSICTNHFESQRYVDCLADLDMKLDADGYFTLVVSDAGNRPAGLAGVPGMNWLPWGGPYYDSLVIYRHMLPADDGAGFPEAIQNQPYGADLESGMGAYYPRAAYCDRATVEAALAAGADLLSACQD